MSYLSKLVFKWLPERSWEKWMCSDMQELLTVLRREGISVIKVGEENYKSPTGLIFVDKPFDAEKVIGMLPGNTNVVGSKKFASTLVCNRHFTALTYEEGVK